MGGSYLMTPSLAYAYPRCRGVLVRDDDEWVCLLCARVFDPPATLPKVMGDGDLGHQSKYVRREGQRRYRRR